MPLAMLVFGQATGSIINYVSKVTTGNLTDIQKDEAASEVIDFIQLFAINMSLIGLASVVLSYIGNTMLSYSASRQVSVFYFIKIFKLQWKIFRRILFVNYTCRVY